MTEIFYECPECGLVNGAKAQIVGGSLKLTCEHGHEVVLNA